jgi:tight adherence protein C
MRLKCIYELFYQKSFNYRLLAAFLIVFNISSIFAQGNYKVIGREPSEEAFSRYRKECFLNEEKVKKAFRECTKYYNEAVEEIPEEEFIDWRESVDKYYKKGFKKENVAQKAYRTNSSQYWFQNCKEFYPNRPPGFRRGDPLSCLAYGEMLESRANEDGAVIAYQKACGLDYIVPGYLNSNDLVRREKGVDHLRSYGCVTIAEEKKYNLKDIPYCVPERVTACTRVATLLRVLERPEEAIKYFQRACDAGDKDSCSETGEKKDKWWLILYASIIGIGVAVFIFMRMLFQEQSELQATEQLEDGSADTKDNVSQHGIILKYSRPFFKHYISPVVSSMKFKKRIREKYKQPIASAGLTEIMTPEDFYAFKIFLIVGFPIVFMIVRTFLEETWPLKSIPALSLLGYFYPDIWIKGKVEKRQKDIINSMPFAVDMLALSVEAGLDFIMAMAKVVEKAPKGALTDEFEAVIKEIKIGASRAEALRNMAYRIDSISMTSFTATLIAADSVGASIGPILKNLSIEIRQKRSTAIEKEGATAPTKILFPMIVFIMPAVFLMIAAPMAVEFVTGGK